MTTPQKKALPTKLQEYNNFAKQYRAKYKEIHGVKTVPDYHIKEAFRQMGGISYEEFMKTHKFPEKLSDEEYGKLKEAKVQKKKEKAEKIKSKIDKLSKKKVVEHQMSEIKNVEEKFDNQKFDNLKTKLTAIIAEL